MQVAQQIVLIADVLMIIYIALLMMLLVVQIVDIMMVTVKYATIRLPAVYVVLDIY